jgi:hypothetical protein
MLPVALPPASRRGPTGRVVYRHSDTSDTEVATRPRVRVRVASDGSHGARTSRRPKTPRSRDSVEGASDSEVGDLRARTVTAPGSRP